MRCLLFLCAIFGILCRLMETFALPGVTFIAFSGCGVHGNPSQTWSCNYLTVLRQAGHLLDAQADWDISHGNADVRPTLTTLRLSQSALSQRGFFIRDNIYMLLQGDRKKSQQRSFCITYRIPERINTRKLRQSKRNTTLHIRIC